MHYYSSYAYRYVRTHLKNCLPHPKTISAWYTSINGSPGINIEALKCIKEKAALVDYPLFACITFDEMAIRKNIEFDGSKYYGYVDFGFNNTTNCAEPAKEVLVFLLVCLNQNWKIPIAYFLINKMNAEQKRNIVLQCISAVHNVGMRVVSITCDGMSTNLSVLKLLGCDFNDITSLQTWFLHPETKEKIFVFLDPCHMLKLVRNVIGDLKNIVNRDDQFIRWSDLVNLHELQQQENMHLANKLRSAHIHYHNQKMKVRFAVQIFSTSVANALLFCKNTLKLKEFQSCQSTIEFLQVFNDLFDILNSKNMKQSGFKQPLNEQNKEIITNKLEEIKLHIIFEDNQWRAFN